MAEKRSADTADGPNKRPRATRAGICESDVGITELISSRDSGISGVLKQRYTDFLVNEVDTQGQVVHLRDEGIPDKRERRRERRKAEREDGAAGSEGSDGPDDQPEQPEQPEQPQREIPAVSEAHRAQLVQLFGEEDYARLLELFSTGAYLETARTFDDKAQRTQIHQLVREAFQGRLETLTTDDNTFKVALRTRGERKGEKGFRRVGAEGKLQHGLGPKLEYLHFDLYKENKETMEVAALLAKMLKIPSKWIKYAGTKDRRAVTVQRLCVEKLGVERVNSLNRVLKGIRLGGFRYADAALSLGDLQGNAFVVTIKNAQSLDPARPVEEAVADALGSLREHGFINYFGLQRFGTFSVSTHHVGAQLLQGHWKAAVDMILSEQEVVVPDSVEARRVWAATRDPRLAAAQMPKRCSAESSILRRLEKERRSDDGDWNGHSYFNAIMAIPRNLRIMYGHAYQSYVWNLVASRRVQLFGLRCVVGDLVLAERQQTPAVDDGFREDVRQDDFVRAKVVTEADVDSYSVYDVVLPTPGFDIRYPENPQLKQVYVDVMARDGLDPDNMAGRIREFSLAGSYRKLMGRVQNLEYFIRRYADPNEPLVRTDLEMLRLRQQLQAEGSAAPEVQQILDGDASGPHTAVIVKMQLGVSAYATMALRELLRDETW